MTPIYRVVISSQLVSQPPAPPVHRFTLACGHEAEQSGRVRKMAICRICMAELARTKRLHAGAGELLKAARLVLDRWESGDLAEAVRGLDAAVRAAGGDE